MSTPTTGRVASMYRHRCGGHSSTRCAASGTMSCSWSCPQTIMNMEQMALLSAYAAKSRVLSGCAHTTAVAKLKKRNESKYVCRHHHHRIQASSYPPIPLCETHIRTTPSTNARVPSYCLGTYSGGCAHIAC